MPFTPFHMGPGLLIKAILQGSFSLMVFGWTQIIMDIQPLLVILTGAGHLHGFSHTYIGATLLAMFSALTGKPLSEWGLQVIGVSPWQNAIRIRWWVVFTSAFIGSYSHVILDSLMHTDMQPFYPFDESNGLLGIVTVNQVYQWCVYVGLFGAALYYIVQFLLKRKNEY